MRIIATVTLLIVASGCATTYTTKEHHIPVFAEALDVSIALGNLVDNRLKEGGDRLGPKQIHIGAPKVKNTIADILTRSKRFREVVNVPTDITGTTLSAMLEAARLADCDYLILGEVDQYDVIDLGSNGRAWISTPLEGITLPVGVLVYLVTGRRNGIWMNGVFYDRTAEGVISVSLHLVETENGKIVGHVSNVHSSATKPVNALVYGDLSNPDDDWVDIGKELGGVALHNLGVRLIHRIEQELQRIRGKVPAPEAPGR